MLRLTARNRAFLLCACGFFALITLTGCGAESSTVPVSGIVTQNGKPVEGATVTFVRGSGDLSKGEIASGRTDASGRYELTTHFGPKSSAQGAPPGEYKITVSKQVPPPGIPAEKYKAMVDAQNKAGENGATLPLNQLPPPMVEYFPPRYSSPEQSQMKVTVEKGKTEYEIKVDWLQ
jgi:hypothetical protein